MQFVDNLGKDLLFGVTMHIFKNECVTNVNFFTSERKHREHWI